MNQTNVLSQLADLILPLCWNQCDINEFINALNNSENIDDSTVQKLANILNDKKTSLPETRISKKHLPQYIANAVALAAFASDTDELTNIAELAIRNFSHGLTKN